MLLEKNKKKEFDPNYSISSKLLMNVYLFYGFILFLFGSNIENFIKNISSLQKMGLLLITVGLTIYSINMGGFRKNIKTKTAFKYAIVATTLILTSNYIFNLDSLALSKLSVFIYLPALFYTIFILSIELIMHLFILWKNVDRSIKDPNEKITVLITFFGILISLLTLLK